MTVAHRQETGRDRIARYCGGFEIHCPMDAGVQIPLSAPSDVESIWFFSQLTDDIH